jgi:anaerobic selenocysteine-containing dehydrogenase
MEINRREFLQMLGIATGGLALSSCGIDPRWSVPDELVKLAQRGPGIETWRNTICGQCTGGCGVKVRLIDGIPVKIEGNPMSPLNRGGMCPQGMAGLDVLYSPDRLKTPMIRHGNKGKTAQWKPISWDEAIDKVVSRLSKLRAEGQPHKLAILKQDTSMLMNDIFTMFMRAYGSPNLIDADDKQAQFLAFYLTQGLKEEFIGYDLAQAKYILNFGANIFEEEPAPVHYMRAYSQLRSQKGKRAKIIHISPRLSITGLKSAEWLPIKPATYGVLALGIAHVLIKEGLYDHDFVTRYTSGFDQWKNYVLKEFYPRKTSQITGIPVEQILKISREFGYTRPNLAIGNHNTVASSNGLFNMLAVHALNALVGAFEKPGGVVLPYQIPFSNLPGLRLDKIAHNGLNQLALDTYNNLKSTKVFVENILSEEKLYSLDTLFIYNSNPVFTSPYHEKFKLALEKIPFIVSFSNFIDETTEYADIILPDHCWLEKWDTNSQIPLVNFPWLGIQNPVVKPFYDTRQTGDVILQIASQINGISLPYKNSFELLKYRVKGIFKTGRGVVISEMFEEAWSDFLKKRGWQSLRYTNFEEFFKIMVEQGGWWEPDYRYGDYKRVFKTQDNKFRFVILHDKKYVPEFKGDKTKFSLHLNTFAVITNHKGKGSNSPLLQEIFGFYHKRYWQSWVEINPETAHKLHLRDGDMVEVESVVGKIRLPVKIYPGTRPEVVNIPFGLGHTSFGRYAKGIGVNPYTILVEDTDRLSGFPAISSTRVRIRRI